LGLSFAALETEGIMGSIAAKLSLELYSSHQRSMYVSHCRLEQCFSTAGPRPGTGPWHQFYQAARGSPGSCHFSFLRIFHE